MTEAHRRCHRGMQDIPQGHTPGVYRSCHRGMQEVHTGIREVPPRQRHTGGATATQAYRRWTIDIREVQQRHRHTPGATKAYTRCDGGVQKLPQRHTEDATEAHTRCHRDIQEVLQRHTGDATESLLYVSVAPGVRLCGIYCMPLSGRRRCHARIAPTH
jgi:hypothetical protein